MPQLNIPSSLLEVQRILQKSPSRIRQDSSASFIESLQKSTPEPVKEINNQEIPAEVEKNEEQEDWN